MRLVGALIAALAFAALTLSAPRAWANDQIEKTNESMVRVLAFNSGQDGKSDPRSLQTGSGFVVDRERGLIVTNNHVVVDGLGRQLASVLLVPAGRDPKTDALSARIVARDSKRDLALLQTDAALDLRALVIVREPPAQATKVWAVGFPVDSDVIQGEMRSTTSSRAGEVMREVDRSGEGGAQAGVMLVQHSAELRTGNSGGPLVDACGRVVGVNNAVYKVDRTQNPINTAVATPEVLNFVKSNDPDARLKEVRRACTETTPISDPRLWVAAGSALAVVLGIFLIVLLRNRRRAAPRSLTEPPPPPAGAYGGPTGYQGGPAGGYPGMQPAGRPGAAPHGLVFAGFDAKGRRVSVQFSPANLERGAILGRGSAAGRGSLPDDRVSRRHARITWQDGEFFIEDLASSNKTYLNDKEIPANQPVRIRLNDKVRVGPIDLLVSRW